MMTHLFCANIKDAIDCFECVSFNHDNPDCEDTFYRSEKIGLHKNCMVHQPNKTGSYRASHCIKLVASGNLDSFFFTSSKL